MSVVGNIDEHLDEVFGIIENPKKEMGKTERVVPVVTEDDSDSDFQYARENLYNLIERGQDGLDELLEIAKASQHPRAIEVIGQLVDKLTTTNKELLNLHKSKKDIKTERGGPTSVNNNLFVGSTAELQKFLKKEKVVEEEK